MKLNVWGDDDSRRRRCPFWRRPGGVIEAGSALTVVHGVVPKVAVVLSEIYYSLLLLILGLFLVLLGLLLLKVVLLVLILLLVLLVLVSRAPLCPPVTGSLLKRFMLLAISPSTYTASASVVKPSRDPWYGVDNHPLNLRARLLHSFGSARDLSHAHRRECVGLGLGRHVDLDAQAGLELLDGAAALAYDAPSALIGDGHEDGGVG